MGTISIAGAPSHAPSHRVPPAPSPWLVAVAVPLVVGAIAWSIQLSGGFSTLGTGDAIAWGAYIAAFFLLAGAGCSLVLLATLSDLDVVPGMASLRQQALMGALAALLTAGVAILLDIGRPLRVVNFLLSPNPASPFVWDFYGLLAAIVVAALALFLGPGVRWLSLLGALVAVLVIVVEAFILGVTTARPLWHGGILAVSFLVEGIAAASALVILLGGERSKALPFLKGLLAGCLALSLFLSLSEAVTSSYGGDQGARDALALLLSGNLAVFYWSQLAFGVALPCLLLLLAGGEPMALGAGAILAIAGVFAGKLNLLVAGQAHPFMQKVASYSPSPVELGGLIGLLGLFATLYLLGTRFLSRSQRS